jgi:hypothetical protein
LRSGVIHMEEKVQVYCKKITVADPYPLPNLAFTDTNIYKHSHAYVHTLTYPHTDVRMHTYTRMHCSCVHAH